MTKINKLVLRGFKSFGKHTELDFGDRFNCVLGPNGSGKSNLLDALCFVFGRVSAKSMRAEKSANLIYNGGKTKTPAKNAEVSIYFDNSKKVFPVEESEVKLSRIVKHNGQSIYKVNDKTRTRQEVIDLLSSAKINPNGYNIILQGDIIRFVEMSTLERRKMIEEIAGIGVYEERKEKALRELDGVEERLKQAEIILKERETYLKELKKDRDQAAKYKDLKDRVNENKATYLHIQIKRKSEAKQKIEKKIVDEEAKLKKIENDIGKLKSEIEERKKEIQRLTKEVEEKGEKDQIALHREIEQIKVNLATKKTTVENHKNELVKIEKRSEQLKLDLSEHQENIGKFEKEINNLEKRKETLANERKQIEESLKKFKEKHKIEDAENIEQQVINIDKEIDEKQIAIQKLRENQQNLLREKDRLEIQINSIDQQLKKVAEIEEENKDEVQKLKNKRKLFEELTQELNKCLNDDSNFAVQIANLRKRLNELSEEIAKLEAENLAIKERASANIA
ncbi:MAG: AAA family ATPase, partial [Candidatus Woesearchaeota archaeon]